LAEVQHKHIKLRKSTFFNTTLMHYRANWWRRIEIILADNW
jgi:hypothetical protein